ncbi:hypothetical protein LINPERHAP1_LOCUS13708 [Linum perenne]
MISIPIIHIWLVIIWVLWKSQKEAIFENKLATSDQLRLYESFTGSLGFERQWKRTRKWTQRLALEDGKRRWVQEGPLQLDSQAAVAAINGAFEDDTFHGRMPQNIEELRRKDWETIVPHIFREDNKIVFLLTHHGHFLELGLHFNCNYPTEVDSSLWSDLCHISFPRMISLNK